jgi:GT2 family glycosyltransferase
LNCWGDDIVDAGVSAKSKIKSGMRRVLGVAWKMISSVRRREVGDSVHHLDRDVSPVRPSAPFPVRPKVSGIDGRPDISVVLGSLNRRVLLERALESVRSNFGELRGEIIVVDGGSTDGSIEWLTNQKDIITIVQHNRYETDGQARRRMSWGRFMNMGFRSAGADRIAMISDDCYLLPGAIAAACARLSAVEKQGLKPGGCAFYFRNWPAEDRYYVQRTLGGNLMINHGIYTRKALEAVGYANEDDFAFYKADSDLSLAIWAAGYSIVTDPAAICEHFQDESELLRISNNQTLEQDRRTLAMRWPELSTPRASEKMGRIYSDYLDPMNLAQQKFGDRIGM